MSRLQLSPATHRINSQLFRVRFTHDTIHYSSFLLDTFFAPLFKNKKQLVGDAGAVDAAARGVVHARCSTDLLCLLRAARRALRLLGARHVYCAFWVFSGQVDSTFQ